jgi:C-terminal processing protease CtpA/Prc
MEEKSMRFLRKFLFGAAIVVSSTFADLTVDQRVADFEYFWDTYKNAYVFFDLKAKDHGVNWDAVKAEFVQKLQNSTSDRELYAAVTAAQAALQDGHCYNQAFSKIRETERIFFQRIGFKQADGHKVVVDIVPDGSVFQEAGIETGWELVSFDGKTVRQMVKEMSPLIAASSEGQLWSNFVNQLYIHSPLLGKPTSPKAEMVFRDFDGNLVKVDSPWMSAAPTGTQKSDSSFIDEETGVSLDDAAQVKVRGPLPMEVRIFKDLNIAYVKIESWMKTEDPIKQFEKVFKAIRKTDGMILDLRDNGGGVGPWGVLFTNYLVAKSETGKNPNDAYFHRNLSKTFFKVAFSQLTDEQIEELFHDPASMKYVLKKAFDIEMSDEELMEHFVDGEFKDLWVILGLNDRTNKIDTYTKPVYALTNGGCFSTTDICLTILKEFKRIKIVGTPNGAGSGSPIPFVLPNSGLQVYVPHAIGFPPHSTMIEGRPLRPDIMVSPTATDIAKGKDTVLTEAVRALAQELIPFNNFTGEEVDVEMPASVYSTIDKKEINWGEIPTPDFAIEATIKHLRNSDLNLDEIKK